MVRFLRVLTTFVLINGASMFKFSSRNVRVHSKNFFHTMKKESGDLKSLSNFYKPKTPNQELYVNHLNDPGTKILFAIGPAGTGKTMLACNQAIKELKSGNIQKIVITRPVIPVEEEEIGFLPGNINKKMDPWTRPIFDIFYDFYQKGDVDKMLYNNIIEISPLAFMRGRTFKNSYIIADEMQNSSPNQMLMLTTRIGQGSKMIITGDSKQSDRGINSGLSDFITRFKNYEKYLSKSGNETNIGIKIVELGRGDVERSRVVVRILDIYDFNSNSLKFNETEKPENVANITTPVQVTTRPLRALNNDAALIPISHMSPRVRE